MQDAELGKRHTLGIAQVERSRKLDLQPAVLAQNRARRRRCLRIGGHVDGKQPAGKAALPRARQIDVALLAALEEAAPGRVLPGCSIGALVDTLSLQQP